MTETHYRPAWAKWLMIIAVIIMWASVVLSVITDSLGWWEVVGAAFLTVAAVLVWMEK